MGVCLVAWRTKKGDKKMKRIFHTIFVSVVILLLSSCGRPIPIEDLTIALILGVDIDEENNLVISESSPVFSEDAPKNIATYEVKAKTIRESRELFNVRATGDVTAAKIQVFLIGKRVLEQDNWFSMLDTVYRNPTFSINTRVIVVDGPVADVIFYEPDNKPPLPLHLKGLIDKYTMRTTDVIITFQELHRQMYEKGLTAFIPELIKDNDLRLNGLTLLDGDGKYVDSLSINESLLLLVLKGEQKHELTLTFPVTSVEEDGGIFNLNEISIAFSNINTKVKSSYKDDEFSFDFNIKMRGSIAERLFVTGSMKEDELKKMLEKELKSQFEDLINKIQENKIDPIGLGLYARAYHYEQFKKVEDNWGEALAEANINVSVEVEIKSPGAVK